jgi:NCS1 family nucleobase:cation symporter-1
MNKFLYPSLAVICVVFAGIFGWAIHANGGPGDLVKPAIEISEGSGFRNEDVDVLGGGRIHRWLGTS